MWAGEMNDPQRVLCDGWRNLVQSIATVQL